MMTSPGLSICGVSTFVHHSSNRRLVGAHEAPLASFDQDEQTGGGNGGSSSGGTAAIAKSGQDVKVAGGRETVVGDPRVEWWKFADEQQNQDRDLNDEALAANGSRVEVKNSLRLRAEIAQHKKGNPPESI